VVDNQFVLSLSEHAGATGFVFLGALYYPCRNGLLGGHKKNGDISERS
jgi:hypothetical protein